MVAIIKTKGMRNGKGELRKFSMDRGRLQANITAVFKHYYVLCSLRGLDFTSGLLIFKQCEPEEISNIFEYLYSHL